MDSIKKAREIEGYEGKYLATPMGQIVSLKQKKPSLLSPGQSKPGDYLRVVLHVNGRRRTHYVHRLIAEAFIPKPAGDGPYEVNHRDGKKANNRVDNLEWVTRQENIQHARKNGFFPKCIKPTPKILDEARVRAIKNAAKKGQTQREIARQYGVSQPCVHSIVRGKTWKHLPDDGQNAAA